MGCYPIHKKYQTEQEPLLENIVGDQLFRELTLPAEMMDLVCVADFGMWSFVRSFSMPRTVGKD